MVDLSLITNPSFMEYTLTDLADIMEFHSGVNSRGNCKTCKDRAPCSVYRLADALKGALAEKSPLVILDPNTLNPLSKVPVTYKLPPEPTDPLIRLYDKQNRWYRRRATNEWTSPYTAHTLSWPVLFTRCPLTVHYQKES